jgi:protein-disulfide isomerase
MPLVLFACALAVPAGGCNETPHDDVHRRVVDLHGDEPALGRRDAAVEVVVWADLAAPSTARWLAPLIDRAREPLSEVKLVWKSLPATAAGLELARTAMAADEQDRFWDYVVAATSAADDPIAAAGLDPDAVTEALQSGRVDELVKRDLADGRILGLAGTPVLWINGREVPGAPSGTRLATLINEELARAESMLALGFARDRLDADLFGVAKQSPPAPRFIASSALLAARPTDLDTSRAPVLGPAGAEVELAVVGDYGCAFSHAAFNLGRVVRDAFPGQVRLKFIHRPDPTRPDRQLAAWAVAAAREHGAFWRMHFALLDYRGTFTQAELERLAGAGGLDPSVVARELEARGTPTAAVDGDGEAGATPAFIVNGLQLDGLVTAETLKSLVFIQRLRADDRALVSTL